MSGSSIPLLLFAKAPIAGKVKTRLQSHCSADQAADIAEALLDESLRTACSHWPGNVFVSTWLDSRHPRLQEVCKRHDVQILKQCEGDLGVKMNHAFGEYGYPLAIMGSDAPHIAPQTLLHLHELLSCGQAAIGPSLDGGYYIIGLSLPAPFLFQNMPWGQDQVLSLTRQYAQENGLELVELQALQDIDEWPDLLATLERLPRLKRYLIGQALL